MKDITIPLEIDGIPVLRCIPNLDEEDGVMAVSFVGSPANKTAFIALSDVGDIDVSKIHFDVLKLSVMPEKREVTGVVLRPNNPILRIHEETKQPYYFYMTPEDIENTVDDFMRKKRTDVVDVNHDGQLREGVFLKENFYMTPEYREKHSQFSDIEDGAWMVTYKVDNDELWADVVKGEVQGFSPLLKGDLKAQESNDDGYVEQLKAITRLMKQIKATQDNKVN